MKTAAQFDIIARLPGNRPGPVTTPEQKLVLLQLDAKERFYSSFKNSDQIHNTNKP